MIGETDELGLRAVGERYHMRDFHATILHLLGLDQNRLWFLHNGRQEKLTDFGGTVIRRCWRERAASHFGEGGLAAFDGRQLVLPPDGPDHQLYVRNGAGGPFGNVYEQDGFVYRIGPVAPVHGTGHLVDLIRTFRRQFHLVLPLDRSGALQREEHAAEQHFRAVI